MIRNRVLCVVAVAVLSVVLYSTIRSNVAEKPSGAILVDRTRVSASSGVALVCGEKADLWEFHNRFMKCLRPSYRTDLIKARFFYAMRHFAICDTVSRQTVLNRIYAQESIDNYGTLYLFDVGRGTEAIDSTIESMRRAGWEVEIREREKDERDLGHRSGTDERAKDGG